MVRLSSRRHDRNAMSSELLWPSSKKTVDWSAKTTLLVASELQKPSPLPERSSPTTASRNPRQRFCPIETASPPTGSQIPPHSASAAVDSSAGAISELCWLATAVPPVGSPAPTPTSSPPTCASPSKCSSPTLTSSRQPRPPHRPIATASPFTRPGIPRPSASRAANSSLRPFSRFCWLTTAAPPLGSEPPAPISSIPMRSSPVATSSCLPRPRTCLAETASPPTASENPLLSASIAADSSP
mmetsp:Transcript_40877/g.112379  ORF Transcript_40877/g.112379 Transcript_40877/m.112379 type:complete len:242 (+) Transcript_40877:681-1406(+)